MDINNFINLDLVKNPLNWVVVIVSLAFGLIALHQIQPALNQIAGTTARVL
jgi:hypothetical protein